MKKYFSSSIITILQLIIAILFFIGISRAFASWNEPTATPPDNNTPAPLNVSTSTQTIGNSSITDGSLKTIAGDFIFNSVNTLNYITSYTGFCIGRSCVTSWPGGGVSKIIAGSNITISPSSGTGVVTINSSGGSSGSGYWTTSGNDIYNTNSGKVGIGANNPLEKLDVEGNLYTSGFGKFGNLNSINSGITLWGSPKGVLVGTDNGMMVGIGMSGNGSTGVGISNGPTQYGSFGWDSTNNYLYVSAYGRSLILDSDPGRNVFLKLNQGNVGIGTANPSQKLEVAGNIKAGRFYMGDSQYSTNAPGIGTDGTNVGAVTNGVFSVITPWGGFARAYASDFCTDRGQCLSQFGGGGFGGGAGGAGGGFGARQLLASGTYSADTVIYSSTAPTDGFVTVNIGVSGSWSHNSVSVWASGAKLGQLNVSAGSSVEEEAASFPIRKGEWGSVNFGHDFGAATVYVYWVPLQ